MTLRLPNNVQRNNALLASPPRLMPTIHSERHTEIIPNEWHWKQERCWCAEERIASARYPRKIVWIEGDRKTAVGSQPQTAAAAAAAPAFSLSLSSSSLLDHPHTSTLLQWWRRVPQRHLAVTCEIAHRRSRLNARQSVRKIRATYKLATMALYNRLNIFIRFIQVFQQKKYSKMPVSNQN